MREPPLDEAHPSHFARAVLNGPRLLLIGFAVFVAMQLVPYRVHNHAAASEPNWNAPRTRELAVTACHDCHSNETRRVWYEQVAPISWWITSHMDEGRAALNFSECATNRERDESAEAVRAGSMPPSYYTWFGLHADARLSQAERRELAAGLTATARRGCASRR
jgi:hypothetical protein